MQHWIPLKVDLLYGKASATRVTDTPSPKMFPTAWEKALACADSAAACPDPLTKVPSTSKVISVKALILTMRDNKIPIKENRLSIIITEKKSQ